MRRAGAGRTRRVLGALLVAVLGASGSCGLPETGPVQQGLDIGSPLMPPVRFEFEAPPRGATPEQIVRGFLAASWSMDDDFRAARAYLTPHASRAWNPRSAVTVYPDSGSLQVVATGPTTMALQTRQDAALDSSGRYRSLPVGTTRESVLGLERASGEWRISSIPPDFGLWISRFYFERAYRLFSIAYADPRLHTIVADRRWLPVGAGLTTTLARALVEAPPAYLLGAVRSGFPAGTRLSVDSVPVEFGQAAVDLNPGVLDVSADERRAAWAQALTTIRQAPEVESVALQVAGRNLDVVVGGRTGTVPTTLEELGFGPSAPPVTKVLWRTAAGLTALDSGELGRDDDSGRAQSPVLPAVGAQWQWVAASGDLADVAAISADRRVLQRWRGQATGATPGIGGALTPPSYDRAGRLWIGGSAADGEAGSGSSTPPGVSTRGRAR